MGQEGLMYHVRHTEGICSVLTLLHRFTGNHDHRNLIQELLLFHVIQHFKTILDRHDNIKENKDNIPIALNLAHCLQTILRLKQFIIIFIVPKYLRKYLAVYFFVINNQYLLSVHFVTIIFPVLILSP